MNLNEALDIAKDKTGSDNLTAKKIGITSAVISNWRTGKREPTNRQALELAALIGVHWSVVVKASEIAAAIRRGEPGEAARWERVSTVKQWLIVAVLAGLISSAPTPASAMQSMGYEEKPRIYIMGLVGSAGCARNGCAIRRRLPRGYAPHPLAVKQGGTQVVEPSQGGSIAAHRTAAMRISARKVAATYCRKRRKVSMF